MAEKDKTPTAKAADRQASDQSEQSDPTREGDRYGAPGIPGNPSGEKGGNLAESQQRSAEIRTTVPDSPSEFTVDARLDNRSGADRPPLQTYPAVPQQVDGPDVVNQAEFTRRYLDSGGSVDTGRRLGMYSVGPHGITPDESVRSGNDNANESGGEPAPDGETGAPEATLAASREKSARR